MRLFKRGKTVDSAPWRLHFAAGGAATPRFAVVIAKRHAKKAVTRNRLRRQLREAFRQDYRQSLPAADFVLRAVSDVSLCDGHEARDDCRRLLAAAVARQRR